MTSVIIELCSGMAATLTGLYIAHRKQRDIDRAKRAQYWREQVSTVVVAFIRSHLQLSLERIPPKSHADA